MAEMKTLTVGGKTYTVVDEAARTAAANAQAAIPTKTSQLSNDSGFITSAPVTSVNGKTGAVQLGASDVGASATGHKHTKSEITDFPTSMTPTAHNHSASDINSGTLGSDRLPTVPLTKGGTGATSASAARTALGIKSETWTFTLADGSTTTKAVYVG